ncbi:putative ABC transport system permease protein [Pacificibacter maritimus]|uniref:Putative ABC transport system permease protein n=1 Tax=Pacificibacter maritimus TaxID=762213 RepID=A0A3N4U6T7_9RHOB|nr:FtsX-like permease family protein [Pacificibacter maritimus]RPE66466.1 putative ABC transport system permease protein [Pacificibacter maritimus]
MNIALAWKIARRELRGGLRGFRVLIVCLALSVAAIAAVTSVRESIFSGLENEGAALLGGDAELEFTYRFATPEERAWLEDNSLALSEITDFRSMITKGDERALTQVKSVDAAYPLIGTVELTPPMTLEQAFDGKNGISGAVLDPMLIERLGLEIGDDILVGEVPFIVMAALTREPDNASVGFSLGPRSMVRTEDLRGSNLLSPGTLFESAYRLKLPENTDLEAQKQITQTALSDAAYRWRDARNGAPGMSRFVDRLGSFLVLVGLAGLAVGGVGVSSAVRAYLDRKTATIATLKTLGADRQTIFMVYMFQIGVLTLCAIAIGLLIGGAVPVLLGPVIEAMLPLPAQIGVYPSSLFEAALYGIISAAIFVLWPLARTESIRPAALYRGSHTGLQGLPRAPYLVALASLVGALIFSAVLFSNSAALVLWSFGGLAAAFVILVLAASGLRYAAKWMAAKRITKGRPALRLALGSIGGPSGDTLSVVLSLGLGLTVLSAVGQIDTNLRGAIANELPSVAPSYFVIDIQKDQIDGILTELENTTGVTDYETAPMLRGVITKINGQDAKEVSGNHWVVRGDRGVTYSAAKPDNAKITQGTWWPEDYSGDPQVSFADEEAKEMGLSLGDTITLNILGRDITSTITSFREVDFSSAGMGFVLSMNPASISAAPHTHIATIYATAEAEAPLIRSLSKAYPNITTIRVRDAIDRVVEVMKSIAAATTLGAMATLITGAVVLVGAAAAGEEKRRYEAAILKTLGATRARVLWSFALRSLYMGAATAGVAIFAGGVAAWAVTHFVMKSSFTFNWGASLIIVLGGVALTLLTSLWFSWRAMGVRPAVVLRSKD